MSRINNIDQHISDAASSVILTPSTTIFPNTVTDLQKMASSFDAHVLSPLPTATDSVYGLARLGTSQEVAAGILTDVIVTPATLQARWIRPNASETVWGLTKYASGTGLTEANKSAELSLNTNGMWAIIRSHSGATESLRGTMSISTAAAARAGTDNTTAMTPAKVKIAIDTFAVTSIAGANENTTGTSKTAPSIITNVNQHAGIAVSPRGFITTRATETRVGTTMIATQAQAAAGVDNTVVLTPANIPTASYSQRGMVQLYGSYQSGNHTMAMTPHGGQAIVDYANNTFVRRTGDVMSGSLTASYMYSTVSQQTSGNALVRLDYLNARLSETLSAAASATSGMTISRGWHRGAFNMSWGSWYDIGTAYYAASTATRYGRVIIPVFHADQQGGGCRPGYHFSIRVEHSDGSATQQVVSRMFVGHDKYGNGLTVSFSPQLTFRIPAGCRWTTVKAIAHNAECMISPRMDDGCIIMYVTA